MQVSQCCHHGVLGCEIHEHLHPDLLLESLHDVGLVLQLLPQLGDGVVRLLLQGGEASLQVRDLRGEQGDLRGEQSVSGERCQSDVIPPHSLYTPHCSSWPTGTLTALVVRLAGSVGKT